MRNASKNTIKIVMRNAKRNQDRGLYYSAQFQDYSVETSRIYFLFNDVGAQIYRMSKGKICNRSLSGYRKYYCLQHQQTPPNQ